MRVTKPSVKKTKTPRARKPFSQKVFIVVIVVLMAAGVFVLTVVNLLKKPQTSTEQHYQGVVELWNIESFEGGSGSRSSWLIGNAAKFEQSHKGLFVHVTNLTEQQLKDKLDCGDTFDIICFSRGVGTVVQSLLSPYTGSVADVKENLLLSGQLNNAVYALPLYAGSYCLFARQQQLEANTDLVATALTNTYTRKIGKTTHQLAPLICGFTPHNSPLSALALAGCKGSVNLSEDVTQYSAYEQFLANKTAVTLLGTQRDLYRLTQRQASGKIEPLEICPLSGYTDLVQYLGISSTCAEKLSSCTSFLQYLISQKAQETLLNINMFSVLEQTFYTDTLYHACEKGLAQSYVPSVFGDADAVSAQRKTAISTLGM